MKPSFIPFGGDTRHTEQLMGLRALILGFIMNWDQTFSEAGSGILQAHNIHGGLEERCLWTQI